MSAILNSRRYTLREIAKLLNVHICTVWRWYLRGIGGRKLTTILVGGRRFVLAADLDLFLARGSPNQHVDDIDLHHRAEDAGRILDAIGVRAESTPPVDRQDDPVETPNSESALADLRSNAGDTPSAQFAEGFVPEMTLPEGDPMSDDSISSASSSVSNTRPDDDLLARARAVLPALTPNRRNLEALKRELGLPNSGPLMKFEEILRAEGLLTCRPEKVPISPATVTIAAGVIEGRPNPSATVRAQRSPSVELDKSPKVPKQSTPTKLGTSAGDTPATAPPAAATEKQSAAIPAPAKPTTNATKNRRRMFAPLAQLRAYPRQADFFRVSDPEKIRVLAADIKRNGLRQPILVMPHNNRAGLPGGTILDGHDRIAAVKLLGGVRILIEVQDDLRDADPNQVEAIYLSMNLTRKHLDRLDQARALRRIFEIEKGRRADALTDGDQREARDRVGALIGMSGKNLERYWAVLRAPLSVQRAFQTGVVTLIEAARVGLLPEDKKAELERGIRSLKDTAAVHATIAKFFSPSPSRSRRKVDKVKTLVLAIRSAHSAIGRNPQKVDPSMVLPHVFELRRAVGFIQALLRAIEKG